ncbi:MAG: S8 family serine peptidase [Sideroxydans sp.]|nr:S8 family serine peptidase [Sideroxydans sp.]
MPAAEAIAMKRVCGAVMLGLACSSVAQAAVIDTELEREMDKRAPYEEMQVIVTLSDRVDHHRFENKDRHQRDNKLYRALKDKARISQKPHRDFLQRRGAHRMRELWGINGIAVSARADVIRELAARKGIASIRVDSLLQAPAVNYAAAASPPEWNLNTIQIPGLWSQGINGSGVVVANMDTGVDANHPDLASRWRGGNNSWFDPHGQHATPYDASGHGTQTMSIMVGGDIGGSAIGVAPGAQWIATKIYNDAGQATYSDIHLAFQWLLDPDGNPNTLDAPDVVNASWGLVGNAGQCITEFSNDIDALKTAGIAVTFAAGNDGPAPLTSLSPANNVSGFATGAVDQTLALASFSARGPSACDGLIFPKLTAPGVGIKVADLSLGGLPQYAYVSGTSYAAPHAAGTLALLAGAFPNASVAELDAALTQSARDLGVGGADNGYGYGLVDAASAYTRLNTPALNPPVIVSTPLLTTLPGHAYAYKVTASDPDGGPLSFSLDQAPPGMTLKTTSDFIAWIGWWPGYAQTGSHIVTVRATDPSGLSSTQSFNLAVQDTNRPPLAANDSYSMIKGGTLYIAAPGLLANDSDPDAGDTLTSTNYGMPSGGSLTGNADGSFSYTPPATYSGMVRFAYLARDNHGTASPQAGFVSIAVRGNHAPQTVADLAATAPATALDINVLANDSDPDTAIDPANHIDPATVFIPFGGQPDQGGTVTVNADGSIHYAPRPGFSGSERFTYAVKDNYGPPYISKAAQVQVNVQ